MLVLVTTTASLQAGPIEDAAALLKAKKYHLVDARLSKLLDQASPPAEALSISLDAAEADGRFMTAQRRIKALLAVRGMKDLALVFRAAKIARLSANYSDALGKYLYYAQNQKQARPELKEAMAHLLRRGAYPKIYERYVNLFGPGGRAWNYGLMLLDRMIDARDGLGICEQAELLLKTYPDEDRVSEVHVRVRNAVASGATGSTGKNRYVAPLLVMAKARPANSDAILWLTGQTTLHMTPADRINVLFTMQDAWKRPLRSELFSAFGQLSAITDVDHRVQLAKRFLALEPLYRNSPDPQHYAWFVRMIASHPQVFAAEGKVLVTPATIEQRFDALKARLKDDPKAIAPVLRIIQQVFLTKDAKARQAFLTKNIAILTTVNFTDLLTLTGGKGWDGFLAKAIAGRDFETALGLRLATMRWINKSVDPQMKVLTAARAALEAAQAEQKRLDAASAAATKRANAAGNPEQKKALRDKAAKAANLSKAQISKVKAAENNVVRAERQIGAGAGKSVDMLQAAIRDYLTAYPATFSSAMVSSDFMYSPLLTTEQKLAMLREIIAKAGPTRRMGDLLTSLASDKKNWGGTPKFEAVRKQLPIKRQGTDLLMRVCASLHEQGGGQRFRKQIEEMVKGVLAKQTTARLLGRKPANVTELLVQRIFDQHFQLMYNDRNGLESMAGIWAPRMAAGAPWEKLTARLLGHSAIWSVGAISRHYIAAVGAGKGSPKVWANLARSRNPENDAKPIFAGVYAKMGWDNALTYLFKQASSNVKGRQGWIDEIARLAASPDFKFSDQQLMLSLNYYLWDWARNKTCKAPASLIATIWKHYLATTDRTKTFSAIFEARTYGAYTWSGHQAEAATFLSEYWKLIEQRSLADRIDSLGMLYETNPPPYEAAGKLESGKFYHMLLEVLPGLYHKALLDKTTVTVHWKFCEQVAWFANQTERHWIPLKARAAALGRTLAELLERDDRYKGGGTYRLKMMDRVILDVIERKDWDLLSRLLPYYARELRNDNWQVNLRERISPVAAALEAKKAYELAYVFAVSIDRQHRLNTRVRKEVQLVKSRAGRMVPGLISAKKTDPSYPLHLAGRALSFGDEARAWELTESRLKLIAQIWESLDPDYVIWVIDQMRAQKQLTAALEMAFTILLREDSLAAETAAQVLLIKGDIYRDMQNYRAAKVEYQALRANKRYRGTRGSAESLYRLVELYITTSDYASAEAILERLTESEDIGIQAEAYFLYAKLATEQKEYKDALKYIKKVRDRVPDHKEAAFLEGELNLVVPGGLASWEEGVRVGDPRLRRVAIPGRVLSMKLRDTNLSIARGGKSVPVIIRTSKGGDEERVDLVASSADNHLFTARITTSLGKVQKGNRNMEILGDDIVSYQIDPAYQKVNDLHYPPKNLIVKADGRLAASSGEILTPEEEDQRALELKMRARAGQDVSRKFDVLRSGTNVRPGSPIYVQVTDDDRDISIARDVVSVHLTTSSGDVIEKYVLKETGPHTAIFRAIVPTDIPLPKAWASDTAEGSRAECLINTTKTDTWISLADARKPKFVEVDTMTSHEMKSISLKTKSVAHIRQLTLFGMLAGDYIELAAYPEKKERQKGGVIVQHVKSAAAVQMMIPAEIRTAANAETAERVWQADPNFTRDNSSLKNAFGWLASRTHGVFYVPEDRTMEIKFGQALSPNNWQVAWLLIDGRVILGGNMTKETIGKTKHIDLVQGLHTFEILVRDYYNKSAASIVYRKDDGTFTPLPPAWFSPKEHPELEEFLRPKGKIATTKEGFVATMNEAVRLRRVRWVFEDFSGNSVSASEIRVVDADGKVVVPGDKDFTSGKTNQILEIAPGDEITVTYRDEHRLASGSPDLTARLRASYFNGNIEIAYEEVFRSGNRVASRYYKAKRFRIGDQLAIRVNDYDEDLTGEADTIDVKAETAGGESIVLKLRETGEHTGIFRQILRTGNKTEGDMIRTRPGDEIIVSFLDRENTTPGIPYDRSYSVWEAGKSTPDPLVYRTTVTMEEDKSEAAQAKALRLKRKMKTKSMPIIYKETVVARHPDYEEAGEQAPVVKLAATEPGEDGNEEIILCSTRAPLLFQAKYPTLALHAGSSYKATVVAESEIRAAKAEGRDPNVLEVRMPLTTIGGAGSSVGYGIRVQSRERYGGESLLTEGIFSGAVRLRLGGPGDDPYALGGSAGAQAFSSARRAPTIIVSGSDVVHIRFQDVVTKKIFTKKVRLQTNGRLDLLDSTYTVRNELIHLGEKFFIRVTDLDADTSNERDEVPVVIRSGSGDELKLALTETLPHSGTFTGSLEPLYAGTGERAKKTIDPNDKSLHLGFGDKLTFDYIDVKSLISDKPRKISDEGQIFFGADAELAVFTKRFKDPEMAVKTRFLMAEALFEIAKHYRKLDRKADANEVLARGKRVLEEALTDYPDTSLASQGKFLLANLSQELSKYPEAIGRYAGVIATWPDSAFAPRSQLKKAICLEKLKNYDQACEEYVKLTYVYPEHPLVADATVRLGHYYYKMKKYDIAGQVFFKFQQRNPTHKLASKALFSSGQCYFKKGDWDTAAKRLDLLVEEYRDDKKVRPQAMYFLGDALFNTGDYKKAYQAFVKLTWDYPRTYWAKVARGRLTEDKLANIQIGTEE